MHASIDNYGLFSEQFILFARPPEVSFSHKIHNDIIGFYFWESAYPEEVLVEIWAGAKGEPLEPAYIVKSHLRQTTNRTALFVVSYAQLERKPYYRLRHWQTTRGDYLLLIERYQIKNGRLDILPIFSGDIMSFPPENRTLDFLNPPVIAAERALLSLKEGDIESPFFIKLEVV